MLMPCQIFVFWTREGDREERKRESKESLVRECLLKGKALSTVDLLVLVACFVKRGNNIFNIKLN
jgi:hypothetical protein